MILVDSREQKPYWKGSQCARTALKVGDYTTVSLLNKFHIERKSLVDLYGTITKGHYRFKREIIRARFSDIELVVVVEGTKKDFKDKNFYGGEDRNIEGSTLIKIVETIERRHKVKFHWCKSRVAAKRKTLYLLNNYSQTKQTKDGKEKNSREKSKSNYRKGNKRNPLPTLRKIKDNGRRNGRRSKKTGRRKR